MRSSCLFVLSLAAHLLFSNSLPLSYEIPHRQLECLFDKLMEDEYLTVSIFVSSGSSLVARAIIEGPVAPASDETGKEISASLQKYGSGVRFGQDMAEKERRWGVDRRGNIHINELVDFENFQYDDDDAGVDDDDAFDEIDDDREREIIHRKRQFQKRKKMYAGGDPAEKMKRKEGEPFQRTLQVGTEGWYRVCVVASDNEITAEFEIRKSSELGPPDKSGHVPTVETHIQVIEEKELDLDAAKEEDLEASKAHVNSIHKLLNDIRQQQESERHRLELHKETNAHSHSRMVLSSLFETLLFIAVTGFQVYTIRKWFSGGPILGR